MKPMTERIFRCILSAAVFALIAGIAVVALAMNGYTRNLRIRELTSELELAAHGVEQMGEDYFETLDGIDDLRFTLMEADGTVTYDSQVDVSLLENHAQREEITEAMETGFGESRRYSATLTEETVYLAKQLPDGRILRAAAESITLFTLLMSILQPISIVILAALALSAFLAYRMARSIVEPLNAIDLDAPLAHPPYEELAPMLDRIHAQHRQIESQMNELRRKTDEFDSVVASMSESLILLNARGQVISINPAARGLLGLDPAKEKNETAPIGVSLSALGQGRAVDGAEIERLGKAFEEAQRTGHSEYKTARDGRVWHVSVSRISRTGSDAGGAVVLGYDITETEYAERNRREFTANVSHELKTPLQSIIGSAELLENGLVAENDVPSFVGRIRAEAQRLVDLIGDIIRLSEMDEYVPGEGGAPETESVDLCATADSVCDTLSEVAGRRGITMTVRHSGDTTVHGARRLLYDIVYNLCDNAVRYNKDGGSVSVTVTGEAGRVVLSVADTGIGIPPEHRNRIFERFYRVDKSHSRETGGTGLGLSIVKHAAQYHNAVITLDSTVGKGTTITAAFPR